MPEVWLIFSPETLWTSKEVDASGIRVELPSEAQQILLTQWKAVLAARYKQEVAGLPDAKSFEREDVVIANSTDNAQRELTEILIDAPDGKRKLSWSEANDLVIFINKTSADLIAQIKGT